MDPAPPDGDVLRDHAWRFLRTTSQHAALLLDASGNITWTNAAAEAIFGAAVLAGHHVSVCFVEEDIATGVPRFETEVAAATGWMEDDRWMRRADGSRFWAEGTTIALRDDQGALLGFLKVLRNRTTQKMATETLRNQVADRATHAEECATAMFTLAHELRNPLATMASCAELLDRLPPDDPRLGATQAMLRRSVGFAVRLVDDLVDTTRASTGRLSLQTEMLAVDELLRSAIATAQERAPQPARRIDLLLPQAELRIEADPLRMQQVFVNLIGNAIRYTPPGRRIWVTAVLQGDSVQVKVEDAGIGISPEVLDRIFDMFSQGHDATMRGGLGIGLSLVKHIVELHGGSVQAQSDGPGQGSKFIVSLPLRQAGASKPVGDG